MREAICIAGVGIGVGLLASFWLAKMFAALWYDVSPADWSSYAIAAFLFVAAAVTASLVPAVRAGRIDPAQVLRSQ